MPRDAVTDFKRSAALIQIAHALDMDADAPEENPLAFGIRAASKIHTMRAEIATLRAHVEKPA